MKHTISPKSKMFYWYRTSTSKTVRFDKHMSANDREIRDNRLKISGTLKNTCS